MKLITNKNLAKKLGVSPPAISNYIKRYPDFPKAQSCTCCGYYPVFDEQTAINWYLEKHLNQAIIELIREQYGE